MKHTIYLAALFVFFISCESNTEDQNNLIPEETTQAIPIEDTLKQVVPDSVIVETMSKPIEEASKNLKMVFKEYSEGDYPHFIFKDTKSGEEYDFRFLADNNLSGLPILLEDEDASFGLKANQKYLGKTFNITIAKKEVLDMDLDGTTIKSKEWVIQKITLLEEKSVQKLPFVGKKYFQIGTTSGEMSFIDIEKDGTFLLGSFSFTEDLDENDRPKESINFKGKYLDIIKETPNGIIIKTKTYDREIYYKIEGNKIYFVDKNGVKKKGCFGPHNSGPHNNFGECGT